ncbi:MAG: rhodanese-like domain-containing protein [Humidesulfovibrio sp.]|uniref:rhodanese-like domain-containing protein n=1 Tax=Humidesulfovibrio sp. TaxID=2910988 RepID=UPI0027F11353|nr:rhodanese-like domain-containing protein [Humidesulfovibrio sp.]MDQ7833906.1 rhodanese-like domain-containing protein [Humidesulfovibrio sp.]
MRHSKLLNHRIGQVFLALILALAFTVQAQAANPDWFYKNLVGIDYVKPLVKVPHPEGVMLIDARPFKGKYIQGYIPTAVSIPDSEFDKHLDLLPKDKNTTLVYYCEGPECKLSHSSAKKAEKLGYKSVKVFPGGYPEWVKAGNVPAIGLEVVKEKISKGENFQLVDSRPLVKFLEGSIPSAVSIPDSAFDKKTGLLPADKATELVFFCGGYACPLSHSSAKKAQALGYTNVKVFEAGEPAWTKAYGAAGGGLKVQTGGVEGAFNTEQFKKIVAEKPESITIIDVRDADEFAAGHIKGSVNMTVNELEKKLPGMKFDKPTVFVCATGARSGEAYYMTREMRKDVKEVYYLEATTKCTKDGNCEIIDNKKK